MIKVFWILHVFDEFAKSVFLFVFANVLHHVVGVVFVALKNAAVDHAAVDQSLCAVVHHVDVEVSGVDLLYGDELVFVHYVVALPFLFARSLPVWILVVFVFFIDFDVNVFVSYVLRV